MISHSSRESDGFRSGPGRTQERNAQKKPTAKPEGSPSVIRTAERKRAPNRTERTIDCPEPGRRIRPKTGTAGGVLTQCGIRSQRESANDHRGFPAIFRRRRGTTLSGTIQGLHSARTIDRHDIFYIHTSQFRGTVLCFFTIPTDGLRIQYSSFQSPHLTPFERCDHLFLQLQLFHDIGF